MAQKHTGRALRALVLLLMSLRMVPLAMSFSYPFNNNNNNNNYQSSINNNGFQSTLGNRNGFQPITNNNRNAYQPISNFQSLNNNNNNNFQSPNSNNNNNNPFALSISRSTRVHATCTMEPAANALYNVTGIIHFVQSVTSLNYPLGLLEVRIQLQGFSTEDSDLEHGMHVHTYGDLSNSCTASGSHYNPLNSVHGARTSPVRHAGDFGNVREDQQGRVVMEFKDRHASLVGDHSIMGRALVIHSGADDNGLGGNDASLKNGNSGSPVACCVIAYASDNSWSGIQDPGIL